MSTRVQLNPSVLTIALIIALWTACDAFSAPTATDTHAIAFFKEHCLRCHGPEKTKGDLRLDQLDADLSKPATFQRWRDVLERVESGEMPPKKEPRPPQAQVADVIGELSA